MKTFKKLTIIAIILWFSLPFGEGWGGAVFSQNIAITDDDGYSPDSSAMLDVKSTTKGMLVPRVTTAQRTAISNPATGLLVFDTNEGSFYFYTGTVWTNLSSGNSNGIWGNTGSSVYLNDTTYKLGIGTVIPVSKLEVKGDTTGSINDPIFEVLNANGDTIFAVYPEGVRINIPEESTKATGNKGGFAVGGFNAAKALTNEYLRVTPDSVRVYIDDDFGSKASGNKGGFAVGGFNAAKSFTDDYMFIERDSSRMYVDGIGGFAVGDISSGPSVNYLDLNPDNYFIGHESGDSITTGMYNSFLGYQCGMSNTTAYDNIFIGYKCGRLTTEGGQNVFIGTEAGINNTNGNHNVFIGYQSGFSNIGGTGIFGDYNVFIGREAGYSNTTGGANTFIGDLAGNSNETGLRNVFLGAWAGIYNISGSRNVFSGYRAGEKHKSGDENVFIGYESGFNDTTGYDNTFVGSDAGYGNASGFDNSFFGARAGMLNSIGTQNVFIGSGCGSGNDQGNNNVFVGYNSGRFNNNAEDNTFIGTYSGYNTNGATSSDSYRNTFIGAASGYNSKTGKQNTYIGYSCAYMDTSSFNNVFIGNRTGYYAYSGINNVYIGSMAGYYSNTASNNIFIGYYAGHDEDSSDKLYIKNSGVDSSQALIYGDFNSDFVMINDYLGVNRVPATNTFEVQGDASKTSAGDWLANSDRRIKTDINNIENSFETILKLRPVKFKYTKEWKKRNPSIEDKYYYNFIAQEYQKVFPNSVKGSGEYLMDDKEEILQIDTYNAQIVTIKAVQELILQNKKQQNIIENQQSKIDNIEKENKYLKAEIENIKTTLNQSVKKLK